VKVELAVPIRPPVEVMESRVDEAWSVTFKKRPVILSCALRVRMLELGIEPSVEVAPMVTTDRVSGVEVPIPTLSVSAMSRTMVPSSCHPDPPEPESVSAEHITLPFESVVSLPPFASAEQSDSSIANPPLVIRKPASVDVAVERKRDASSPCAIVELADVDVARTTPVSTKRDVASPPVIRTPPPNVDVAVVRNRFTPVVVRAPSMVEEAVDRSPE
jgi:hypothetical protein